MLQSISICIPLQIKFETSYAHKFTVIPICFPKQSLTLRKSSSSIDNKILSDKWLCKINICNPVPWEWVGRLWGTASAWPVSETCNHWPKTVHDEVPKSPEGKTGALRRKFFTSSLMSARFSHRTLPPSPSSSDQWQKKFNLITKLTFLKEC